MTVSLVQRYGDDKLMRPGIYTTAAGELGGHCRLLLECG